MLWVNGRFLGQSITGVQRYAREIVKHLTVEMPDIKCLVPANVKLNAVQDSFEYSCHPAGKKTGHLWEQAELPLIVQQLNKKSASDFPLLCLANTAPIAVKNKIVTVHDTAFLNRQWVSASFHYWYKIMVPLTVKNCHKLVTVSDFSRRELMAYLNLPEAAIDVIPNAVSQEFVNSVAQEHPNSYGHYILAVSSLDPRKNFSRLIDAFQLLNMPDLKLVITGSKNRIFKNSNFKERLESNKNVVFSGYVSDTELVGLYKNAQAFVFPSLYEGFGIPPLEAMAAGCPTIVSTAASLPEVCGNASHYVDAESVASIAEGIKAVLQSPHYSKELALKGLQHYKTYSWHASAKQYQHLIESLN